MPGHPVHPVPPVQPAPPAPSAPSRAALTPPGRRRLHPSVGSAAGRPHDDPAGDVVRWAAFSCLLVPVVLVVYGTSYGGAAVATLGLAAVTAACRVLLRHSERNGRAAARVLPDEPVAHGHRGRHSRSGSGAHRGCHGSPAPSPHD
ncbi:hypothetical protein [Streptomyces sp. NPDC001546]|uniref:hypothetical protein n=1 Tax=Streptomyces sp. NPDC001546 TaxID=3364585 RepID=UPI0036B52EF8